MTVAVYLRISKEDKESNSIESQRGMVLHAIEHMPEYADAHIAEFCDDGFSGRNFRRPGVERLLRQVQEGGIQCIIVKDLSRFGRNYLEAGSYIFRVFPALGVRFIALNDGFDSLREMEENSLEVSFRTLLYDIYSRDLSDKVKSALYGKARRGEYVCALAPYGYRKDSTDKHRIVPDADAAAQVRRIFQMAANGQSTRQIARTMNEEQILTPLQYRRANGCGRTVWNCIGEENFWTQQTVARILRDERYTGKAVYGRQKRENAGDLRQVQVKKADWITADDAHPGVVSKEEYALVQEMLHLGSVRGSSQKSGHPLLGKVRCGICGRAMIHAGRNHRYFICHTPRVAPFYACPDLRLSEDDLVQILQDAISRHVRNAVDANRIFSQVQNATRQKRKAADIRRGELHKARLRLEASRKELFEQYALGKLEKEAYLAAKTNITKKLEVLSIQIEKLEAKLAEAARQETPERCINNEVIRQFAADGMQELLQEVTVCPRHLLKITWNFHL